MCCCRALRRNAIASPSRSSCIPKQGTRGDWSCTAVARRDRRSRCLRPSGRSLPPARPCRERSTHTTCRGRKPCSRWPRKMQSSHGAHPLSPCTGKSCGRRRGRGLPRCRTQNPSSQSRGRGPGETPEEPCRGRWDPWRACGASEGRPQGRRWYTEA